MNENKINYLVQYASENRSPVAFLAEVKSSPDCCMPVICDLT